MKGMKGSFLKKLKSIGQIGSLKPRRVLQVTASDGFLDHFPPNSGQVLRFPDSGQVFKAPPVHKTTQPEPDISELLKDLGEEDEEIEHYIGTFDKQNIRPPEPPKVLIPSKENSGVENRNLHQRPLSETSSFRRPDMNSVTLFDPDLLAIFS
ncbi:hypothetical protein MRB53_001763 [Persea americana]|uniref:Uncharacterized protein n=1 Tax=Persea americana TaxID=3435 RepID=A0ACC2MTK4_PERAE|nr:hypothetical protein MRB53_001763 [Persea americana]